MNKVVLYAIRKSKNSKEFNTSKNSIFKKGFPDIESAANWFVKAHKNVYIQADLLSQEEEKIFWNKVFSLAPEAETIGEAYHKYTSTCRNCGRVYSKDDSLLVEVDGEQKSIHQITWRGVLSYSNLCKDCLRMALRVIQDCQRMDPNGMDLDELKIIN